MWYLGHDDEAPVTEKIEKSKSKSETKSKTADTKETKGKSSKDATTKNSKTKNDAKQKSSNNKKDSKTKNGSAKGKGQESEGTPEHWSYEPQRIGYVTLVPRRFTASGTENGYLGGSYNEYYEPIAATVGRHNEDLKNDPLNGRYSHRWAL